MVRPVPTMSGYPYMGMASYTHMSIGRPSVLVRHGGEHFVQILRFLRHG